MTVLLILLAVVVVAGVVFSLVRDRSGDDEEPATLEGGGSHLRS